MSSAMVQTSVWAKSCMSCMNVLKPTLHWVLSRGRDNATTEGQCCSSDDTTAAWPTGPCRAFSHLHVWLQHVWHVLSQQPTSANCPITLQRVYNDELTSFHSILLFTCCFEADVPLLSSFLFIAILILSHPPHITSDCKTDKPSWHVSLPIQTVCLWHTVTMDAVTAPTWPVRAAGSTDRIHHKSRCFRLSWEAL